MGMKSSLTGADRLSAIPAGRELPDHHGPAGGGLGGGGDPALHIRPVHHGGEEQQFRLGIANMDAGRKST